MLNRKYNETIFDSDEQRETYEAIGKIDKLRVSHPLYTQAVSGINGCIKASVFSREPVNCMLLGEGGAGKTSVAMQIVKSMPPRVVKEDDLEISTVPAFYTSFKSARSLDALTTDMLKKLGDPCPDIGKPGDKASRVLKLLNACRTRILFIDELHTLDGFDARNKVKMRDLLKWIKDITNECGPVVCLMGLEECKDIFDGDTEMSRRFKSKFMLRPLSVGTKQTPGLLLRFMTEICRSIMASAPVNSFPPVGEYENALQIWVATRGSPDFIMSLVKEAVLRALLAGRQEVMIEDFASVWDSGLLNSVSLVKFNPFKANQTQIVAAIRKQQA